MTRYAHGTDANHREIVAALRRFGWSVLDLSGVGIPGCPDLLVGARSVNILLEIKSEGGRLRPVQAEWHAEWSGQVAVARTVEEAVLAVQKRVGGR